MTSFRYFRPTSLSWWVGVISLLVGAAQILYPENERFTGLGELLAAISGSGGSPALLIAFGLGTIGVSDKITRSTGE